MGNDVFLNIKLCTTVADIANTFMIVLPGLCQIFWIIESFSKGSVHQNKINKNSVFRE